MVVLGIDLGARRIGLAVSDLGGMVALPVGTLQSHGLERDLKAVGEIARERGAQRVVVGLPIHMSGREGPEAQGARRFAERLSEATGLPVDTLDERWTTLEAERALAETGARRKGKRNIVDDLAATILLRSYLERERLGEDSG